LIDSSEALLEALSSSPDRRSVKDRETSRVIEDRVTVLEQDHRRLNRVLDAKTAVDCEEADFRANERMEDFVVVSGLPRLPQDLGSKEWQKRAVSDVQRVLQLVSDAPVEVVVVQNATPRSKDAEVTYNVKLSSVAEARSIRRKFGSYFKGGEDGRPAPLKSISIANRVTPETKIRISLLKLYAKKYRDSNPGSKATVIGYDSRPLLKLIPPAGSGRVRTFNYIEAVRALPNTFSPDDLAPILKRVNPRLAGQVHATFIVLPDDGIRSVGGSASSGTPEAAEASDAEVEPEGHHAQAAPPPPRSSTSSRSRVNKRGPEGLAGSAAKK
jgi:hypothetical protein